MNLRELENSINLISGFCGVRDVPGLNEENLRKRIGKKQADVMVLFGGSVLAGADVFAEAKKNRVAKTYIIAGGIGHTTEAFYRTVKQTCPAVKTEGLSEAEVFQNYLQVVHCLRADYLETKSTNCGENIANLLQLMEKQNIPCSSILLCHDATMQRRIGATLKRQLEENAERRREGSKNKASNKMDIINYATYQMRVVVKDGKAEFAESVLGMWEMDHYLSLLLGEIQRLRDDETGYGPTGRNFIAHVDVPVDVIDSFERLKAFLSDDIASRRL